MSEAAVAPVAAPKSMGSSVPSSKGEISVSKMSQRSASSGRQTSSATPAAPQKSVEQPKQPEAKSASKRLEEELISRSKPTNQPSTPVADKKVEAAKGDDDNKVEGLDDDFQEPDETSLEDRQNEDESQQVESEQKVTDTKEKKKVNPWKLADEHKAARAKLEAEIAEMKKLGIDPESRKAELARLDELSKRNKELENQIKFVDYTKSAEFVEKYQKPYEQKWQQAMSELKEVTIVDPQSGEERPMQPVDLLQIVNLPLKKAQEAAEELYGSLAPTIMGFRREIRALNDSQNEAISKAREESQRVHKEHQEKIENLRGTVSKTWDEVNKAILENPKVGQFLKPKDGDEEINKVLEAGYKLVDEVMKQNAFDPSLSDEQRRKVVERHAAVRARAAAFGRIRLELARERANSKKLAEKLRQYEESTPDFAAQKKEVSNPSTPTRASDYIEQELRKRAK